MGKVIRLYIGAWIHDCQSEVKVGVFGWWHVWAFCFGGKLATFSAVVAGSESKVGVFKTAVQHKEGMVKGKR